MTRTERSGTHEDLYPSRVGGESGGILERKDPVVYERPQAAGGPLGAEELGRFERDGYLFFEQLFSPEEIRSLTADILREVERRGSEEAPELIREPEHNEIRSIFHVHRSHEAFQRLARDPRLVRVAEQVLGDPVYVHQSRVNLKPGFEGKEFYWHSDFETWHVEDGMPRMRALSFSINLTENRHVNGPLMVIPGSHHYYVVCPGQTPEEHHKVSLRRQEYGVPERERLAWLAERGGIEELTGPPGSVVMFDCNMMHGSNGNITPYPRSNVFFVYNSVENALVEPFCGLPPRPEHIASRDFTPVRSD